MEERNAVGPEYSRYPLPLNGSTVTVTVDMAGDWLDHRCDPEVNIRKASKRKIEQYAVDMVENRWLETPVPLIFDSTGKLIDGQHRLMALRLASQYGVESVDFKIATDWDRKIFSVLDTGYGRNAAQLAGGKYATNRAGAVRYLFPGKIGEYQRGGTPAQILETMSTWPEVDLHAQAAGAAHQVARIPASPHLAVLAQASRTAYRDRIPSWLDGVTHGYDLPPGDARLHLRRRFSEFGSTRLRATSSKELTYNTIAKAWNAYARGDRLTVLQWREVEGTTKIIGTD